MKLDFIDAKKYREEHGIIETEEYIKIKNNNYHFMMVCSFFIGMAIEAFFNLVMK